MPSSNVIRLPSVPALSWDDCRLLVESVADYAIFMLDVDGRVATWNLGAEKIKGYKADEIIGEHFSKFFLPEDVEAGKPENELEIARTVGRFEDESWRVRKDGSRFWANVVITALRDATGELRGYGKVTRDLTARRAAEEELRQAEERFHQLVDAVSDYAIYMLDATGHVATWNVGARKTKGYSAAEVLGKHFSIFYTAEDRRAGKPERVLETVRREGRFEEESWRVRKDGTRFWASVVVTALRSEKGEIVGFAKVTRDLTARLEAEENRRRLVREQTAREVAEEGERRLHESEARYRALSRRLEVILEGIEDGITVQDRSGKLVFANTAAARLCGMQSVDELLRTPRAAIVERFESLDEHGAPVAAEAFPGRRVLDGENPGPVLMQVRDRTTGRHWWSVVRANPVLGEDGVPELAVNILHDVTAEQRQRLQDKYLSEATAVLGSSLVKDEMFSALARVLVPGMADWCSIHVLDGERLCDVAVVHADDAKTATARAYREKVLADRDPAGVVRGVVESGVSSVLNDITEEALTRLGRDAEALAMLRAIGMRAALIAPIKARGRVLGAMALVASAPRRYEAADVALMEELGRRAGVALENASLYRAAQDAASEAKEAAKAAEVANRAKDEFLATVSHELRTPLNAIVGWSTLLRGRVTDPSIAKPIEVIHRNAQAQVKIIDDILDVSRVITGKFRLDPKPSDMVSIAREAIEVIRPSAAAKRLEVAFVPASDICLLVADPERLQQVVWNLLSNAVKFTEPGGKIRVELKQEGSSVIVAVSDTGQGIDPAFLPHVFEQFKQADSTTTRRVGGLGLGLALVRHIVELHGGRVSATSDGLGKGATFTITLPVRAVLPPSPTRAPRDALGPTASLAGVRVLVVDDEQDARDLIATVLLEAGAEVETSRSAREGFEAFRRTIPHVLVSDIGMPDEDGCALIRRIRALPAVQGGRVASLALTAFAREDDRTKALGAGFTTHIGKPVDPEALVAAVANLSTVARPT